MEGKGRRLHQVTSKIVLTFFEFMEVKIKQKRKRMKTQLKEKEDESVRSARGKEERAPSTLSMHLQVSSSIRQSHCYSFSQSNQTSMCHPVKLGKAKKDQVVLSANPHYQCVFCSKQKIQLECPPPTWASQDSSKEVSKLSPLHSVCQYSSLNSVVQQFLCQFLPRVRWLTCQST